MRSREKEWGPFTFFTGTAGVRRRIPKPRVQRVDPSDHLDPWFVGFGVSWLGHDVAVTRARWWSHKATWRNQLACATLRAWDAALGLLAHWPMDVYHSTSRRRGHEPVTVHGDPVPVADGSAVVLVPESVECARCGLVLDGARWVPLP